MKLRFGKYSGLDTADPEIPIAYLKFLEEKLAVKDPLRLDLCAEIRRREGDRPGAGKSVQK